MQWPKDIPYEPMSRERFEQVLVGVRNAATTALRAQEEEGAPAHAASEADTRVVFHAAEAALAILCPSFKPASGAVMDMRLLLSWLDTDDPRWLARERS